MERRNFAQVLKDAKVDIKREYQRIYSMFNYSSERSYSFREVCCKNFDCLPFKGTCISLDDFDDFYGFHFVEFPHKFNVNHLVIYCEYIYNLAKYNTSFPFCCAYTGIDFITQIDKVIELIGYMKMIEEEVTIFVPKSQPAIIVSEMLPPDLSYKIIEYNHHSMNGDLERKCAILKLLADQLESRKDELKGINKQLKDDLFYMFNNISIRHNNAEKIKDISESKLEEWYDYAYELSLLAFITLENSNHKQFVLDIKRELGDIQDH